MRLYFLRHAEASYEAPSDHERPLTDRGRDRTKTAARVLAKLDIKPAHIYASPRVRAADTARIVGEALKIEVELREEVNFDFDVAAVKKLVQGLSERDEIMFVGHNPTMSEVVRALTGASVSLKKGGLARVDVLSPDSLQGELVWLIAPVVFDALDA